MSELTLIKTEKTTPAASSLTVGSNPFRVVVDPAMRAKLKDALIRMIDHHDTTLADFFADGQLSLDSYKEYIELFALSLRETMETREGVAYLLKAAGFEVPPEEINLRPEWRWKA
ncbi:MAG TPA: hypothetical protein VIT21_04585 [Chthoniobacterales bacterium]